LNTFTTVVTSGNATMTNFLTQSLPASQKLSYDLNGNLVSDGSRGYDYDCANELTRVTLTNQWKVEYSYDGFGRRRIRKESSWVGGAWLAANEVHYVYDGMRVVQERSVLNTPTVTYTRGLDLSGTPEGAGGVGGLLARTDVNGSAYYHTDGNGNVTMLVDGSGNVQARYLYDSFGNTLGMWGALATANSYRFSSKEIDWRTGQYYYGFRFYDPNLQRWLNRDPIAELGGINLYDYVANNPINYFDPFGLVTVVAVGLPTSSNPFGHVAIATTGNGVVSFGTGTQFGSDFTDYLNNQATYRSTTLYFLNTTPDQEKAINDYLNTQKGKAINAYPDNCARRTESALDAAGIGDFFHPVYGPSGPPGTVSSDFPSTVGAALNEPGNLQISIPQGTTLPPNFLTGFNPKK
jgi:RHS repeat-associated protein